MSNSTIANTLISSVVVREGYDFDEVRDMLLMADRWERMLLEEKAEEEEEETQQEMWEREFPGLKTEGGWDRKKLKGLRPRHLEFRGYGDDRPNNSKNRSQWLRSGKATRHELARRGW